MKTRHTLCGTGLWTVLFACLSLICTLHAQESVPWDGRTVASSFAGGSGTKDDPYLISNGGELAYLAQLTNNQRGSDGKISEFQTAGKYFRQTKPINLGGHNWQPIGIYITYHLYNDYQTLYLEKNSFNGYFDGGGYEIKGLCFSTPSIQYTNSSSTRESYCVGGLFGVVGISGSLQNIRIDTSSKLAKSIDLSADISTVYIGSVAGWVEGEISNCHSAATIEINYRVGDNVTSRYLYSGGVAGQINAMIRSCSFAGNLSVSSGDDVGGVVGLTYDRVVNCHNTGSIYNGENKYCGGVVGSGTAIACSNTGTITGSTYNKESALGGIVGYGWAQHCYNRGNVSGGTDVAGISASYYGLNYCYSTGDIEAGTGKASYLSCGFEITEGYYLNTIQLQGSTTDTRGTAMTETDMKSHLVDLLRKGSTYWRADTNQKNNGFPVLVVENTINLDYGDYTKAITVPGYTCLDETQLKRQGYETHWYTDTAYTQKWDFSNLIMQDTTLYATYSDVYWTAFADTSFAGGDGRAESPYLIRTPEQLAFLARQTNKMPLLTKGKHYRLEADLNLALTDGELNVTVLWEPIGSTDETPFYGHFDGNGHTIRNMVNKKPFIVENINNAHNQTFYKGLFGYVKNGSIRNLSLENAILTEERAEDYPTESEYLINTNYLYIGALAGFAESSLIENCHVQQDSIHISHTLPYKRGRIYLGGLAGGADSSLFSNNHTQSFISVLDTVNRENNELYLYGGGLIGKSQNSFIEEVSCHLDMLSTSKNQTASQSYYKAYSYGGGIAGCSITDTVLFASSEGKIRTDGEFNSYSACAGILGLHQASLLRHVYSHVNIEGSVNAGGILGTTPSMMNSNKSTLSSAYATGDISGKEIGAIAPSQWAGNYPSSNSILYLESQQLNGTSVYTNPAWQAVSESTLQSDAAVEMLNGTPSSHAFMKDTENANQGFPVFNTRTVTLSFETFNKNTIEPIQALSRRYLRSYAPKDIHWDYDYTGDERGRAEFIHWCTDANLQNAVHPDSTVGIKDRKLYARFTTEIRFNDGYGNDLSPVTYTIGLPFYRSGLPRPSRSGYIFGGWYSDAECRHPVRESDPVRPYGTLYARWETEIHFNARGGSQTDSRNYVVGFPYNDPENPDLPSPEKPGYHFGGWYAEPLFTEQRFASDIVPLQPDTLYAVWGERVTVNFDSRGGSFVEPREYYPQRAYNAVYTLDGQRFNEGLPLNPTKEDAMFEGWFDESLQYQTRVNSTVPDSSHTLYAKWSEKVPVSFESNGGSTFENKEYWSGHPYNYTSFLPTPSKEGAIFVNWYDSPDFEQVVTAQSIVSEEAHTLYAKWSEPFAVSFETFGYCDPIDDYTYYPYYAYRNSYPRNPGLPTYFGNAAENTKSLGWYDSPDFSNQITEQSIVSPDVKTLYLKLSRAQTISFSSEYPCDESRSYYPGFAFRSSSNPGLPTSFRNTETGVYFIGWFTTSDYTEKITDESIVPADLYMLYAKWNRAQTIRFETFGGNTIDNRDYVPGFKYYDYSVSNTGLPTPTREGSYFLGWFTDESFSVQVENNSVVDENVHTLYAKWSTLLSVRFETFGGNTIDNRDYHSGRAFNASPNPGLPTPTKEEARFLGWFDAPDFSTQMTASDIVPENLHTLYAKWAEKTSCTFIDYRENRKENKEFYHNISYNTTPNTGFVRWTAQTTPVFIGWFAKLQKLQNPVRNTDTVPDKRDMTLFARWCVAVDFHTDGGNSLEKGLYEPGMLYGESPNEGLPKPYKAGFSFMGWFADQGLNTSVTDNSLVPDRDHALYAKWKGATIITVSFEMNGGVELSPKTFQADGLRYGDAPNTGLPLPTWVGHRFIGWFANQNLSEAVSDNTVVPSNNHTLYAKWEEDENPEITIVTVSFHTGNGTTVANRDYQADGLKYGEAPNPGLPTEAQTGQGLIGWFADQNLTEAVSNNTVVPTHDHTLYAKWKQGTDAETRNKASLRVYPNPTTGCFFIETTETLVSVELFHQDGRLLRCWKGTEEKMSLEGLSSGLYLLRITTENGILQERLVKF